jgi:hypothetical protein
MADNETVNSNAAQQRTLYPQPGVTPIGRINVKKPDGGFDVYTVDYGNIVDPIMDNKPIFLGTAQYLKMMDAFYQSKAGAQYVIYNEDKLLEDYLTVRRIIEANCAEARQKEADAKAQAEAEAVAKQTQERQADEAYVMDNLYEKDARVRKIVDDKRAKEEKAKADEQQKAVANGPMQSQTLTGKAARKVAMQRAKMLNANGIPTDEPAVQEEPKPEPVPTPTPKTETVMTAPPVPEPEESEEPPHEEEDSQDAYDEAPAESEAYEDEAKDSEEESEQEEEPAEEPQLSRKELRRMKRAAKQAAKKKPEPEKEATETVAQTAIVSRDTLKPILVTMLVFEILIAVILAAEFCIQIFGLSTVMDFLGL